MNQNKIIIIPTYNEELNLDNLLRKIKKIFPNFFILVVDDSPNDFTKNVFENYKNSNCHIIQRKKKLGRGSAVRIGFEYAVKNNYSTIIEMDSDLSHNPEELPSMIHDFEQKNLDILIGSRYLKNSKIINWQKRRIIFSNLGNFLARILFKYSIKDYTNGYRVYRNKFVKKVIEYDQINDGFIYLTEILIIALKYNFKISEYPITFVNRTRGASSVKFKNIVESFIGVLKLKTKKF